MLSRMISTLPKSPLFQTLTKHDKRSVAIIHSESGSSFTYGRLLHDVAAMKEKVLELSKGKSLQGERIAFLAENGYNYVVMFLSIVANDAIALPLAPGFPSPEIRYILNNSAASMFLSTPKFESKARDVLSGDLEGNPHFTVLQGQGTNQQPEHDISLIDEELNRGGFMLYTSGTTNRPKGVVLSVSNILAQARSLIEAWQYSSSDLVLHVLPLHHIHGTINALFTPLMAGSAVEFMSPFNANMVWNRFAAPFMDPPTSSSIKPVTFFTVVPTIYSRLINSFDELHSNTKTAATTALSPENMRLNISGSAALPTPIKTAWSALSKGNVLLERYGMTEVGMALSCGLAFADRVDASVGWPLPSVEIRLVNTDNNRVITDDDQAEPNGTSQEGEIQIRGPTVFSEYWRNPEATSAEFVPAEDGKGKWFKTGDVATRQSVPDAGHSDQSWATGPMYFIKGRSSVDIIKTGGEKVSALEIERELLSLPEIAEAAIVGISSDQWGQKVAAVVVLTPAGSQAGKGGRPWGPMDMRRSLKDKLANYKIPQELKIVQSIPRNAMGKINKKQLVKDLF